MLERKKQFCLSWVISLEGDDSSELDSPSYLSYQELYTITLEIDWAIPLCKLFNLEFCEIHLFVNQWGLINKNGLAKVASLQHGATKGR